ncbi:MAG: two-component regulator propeller domain-containing protein [Paludibacter sp.]
MKKNLYFLLVFFPLLLHAETFTIKKLGMEQGLSNSNIVGITQDKQGCMWFATESGLNRFDGHNFRIYRKNFPTNNSINSNELNQVLADRTDNIVWIATQRTGLNAFNTKSEKFTYFLSDPKNPKSIATNDVTNLTQASDGNLWVCTYHFGVDYLDKKSMHFTHYNKTTVPGFVSNHVWCATDDGQGRLFIGHVFDGLSILSYKDRKIKNYTNNPNDPNSLPGQEVLSILTDKRKNIWIGTNNGLALFNPKTDNFTVFRNIPGKPYSLSSNRILAIKELEGDKLWIATSQGGINILDLQGTTLLDPSLITFQHIYANDDENGLSYQSVKEIYQDSFNNIWIGTLGGGINFISSKNRFFKTHSYSPYRGAKNSLNNKVVWGICTDNYDRVWIGTDGGGIDVFDKGIKTNHYGNETGDLPDNFVISAMKDSDGNLWFGSGSRNVIKYNMKTKQFNVINSINSDVSIRCFFEDNDRNIWIGSNKGLYSYHLPTGSVRKFTSDNSPLPDNVILSVSQDAKGQLWIGTLGQGIAILTPDFRLIKNINTYNGFTSNAIHHILRDSDNRMWVATREGLALFKSVNDLQHYKVFTEKDGMADSYVCAIAEGKRGHIWFSTNSGISQLNVNTNKFINFNYLDGVPRGNFMSGSVAKAKDGTIYFGSQSGACYFNSLTLPFTYKTLAVRITEFSYFDKKTTMQKHTFSIPVADKIELKYNQNTFNISFNIMDFGLNEETEYAYSLKGLDNSWYNLGSEKQVTFRNIPPGKYEFMVKSRLRNQEWSKEITTFQIAIEPPFWLTWWAKSIYFILSAWLIIFILRFYKRRLDLENSLYLEQKNHQQEQVLNDERMSFYTNIAHELRTPLTLIIGPLKDLESDKSLSQLHTKKIALIHRSAIRLLNLINQIMEFRKTETHNRNLCIVKDDLAALVKEIGIKYEGLNRNPDINFKTSIETTETILYYDPEIITIILDNLISNALKYTKRGEIAISMRNAITEQNQITEIEVRDTGVGISPDAQSRIFDRYYQVKNEHHVSGSGIGLSLVKNLAELHQGTISVESEPGQGSTFRFRILTQNHYPEAMYTELSSTSKEPEDTTGSPKGLILIAEDNDEIREYIAGIFSDSFDVLTAVNGKDGTELAFERIPDIIISDIMMPVMDGTEFCKIMKEDIRTSHIPLILLTAKDSLQDKTEGYSIGADSYITKPFSAGLLQSRVNNLLESRKKMAALFSSSQTRKQAAVVESLNKLDKEFLDRITTIIEDNLDSEQINIAFIAERMNMSHSTLYRKIKALTNISANELIRKIKIQNAERLLLTGKYSVSEISFLVGISSSSYFRQCFKEEFGLSPTEYFKQIMEDSKRGKM